MTTIAYRDGKIAGDRQVNSGEMKIGKMTKIARRGDGALAGVCGSMSAGRAFLAWFTDNSPGDAPKFAEKDLAAVVILPDGTIRVHDDLGYHETEAPYYAIGSGRDFALGSMYEGRSAANAVACAGHFDNSTGTEIIVLCREDSGVTTIR